VKLPADSSLPNPIYRSSTEMLSCDNKFFCDACGCLQVGLFGGLTF
jgi:hypothetical protein